MTKKREPGKVYLNLLDQDEIWWTKRGELVNVDEMTPRHVRFLIRYLDRRAKRFHYLTQLRSFSFSMGPYPNENEWWDEEVDPDEWMRSKPLYRKLVAMRDEQFQKELRETLLGDEGKI